MAICPIDIGRYGRKEMKEVFSEENRFQKMLDVEAAVAKAYGELGLIKKEHAEEIARKANVKNVKIERIREIERETRHETMSLVKALTEQCGEAGKYVHLGLTSNDVLDTALALQLKEAIKIIEKDLVKLMETLMGKIERHKDTVMIGRTHGQHALPITLGFKFSVWLREMARHYQRLRQAKERILVGKISGAVGTFSSFKGKGMEIQEKTMKELGLKPAEISTQIIQRDRHTELIMILAMIATTCENIATEIRNLQRTEINELTEYFGEKQVGSSTMPSKRNPVESEKITSLARLIRSFTITSLENMVTWHERDLTNSANERFIIPHSLILTDEILQTLEKVLRKLIVNKEKMIENMGITRGLIMSERIMLELVSMGMGRQEAHELIRKCSMKAIKEKKTFEEAIMENKEIMRLLKKEKIKELLNPVTYLGETREIIRKTISLTRREIRKE